MADEWERFNQLAGRQHRIADGIVVYDETLEPCTPDVAPDPVEELTARVEAQAEIIAHLLGAEVELSAEVVRRATGMEAEELTVVQEQILALAKEPGVSKKL